MPGYKLISAVAASLSTDDATLLDFQRKNWIRVVNRNGNTFLASDQSYRAKYILHLHGEKHLTDDQIDLVLSVQRPPYSAAEVDEILKQNPLADRSKHADG
jgi:hypothetical protein